MSKRYADCVSVRRGDVVFETGRVHAVVGENGAGKSTLLQDGRRAGGPRHRRVLVEGSPLSPHTASEALRRGVGMVQQHFALVPVFTVLRVCARRRARQPWARALAAWGGGRDARLQQIGARVVSTRGVEELGVGDRQRVEIARILFRGARTLILDEPTAVPAREAWRCSTRASASWPAPAAR
ncbi:MAG: ATP-binding cassette domain-containing protein [Polyangiaceae bacterium]